MMSIGMLPRRLEDGEAQTGGANYEDGQPDHLGYRPRHGRTFEVEADSSARRRSQTSRRAPSSQARREITMAVRNAQRPRRQRPSGLASSRRARATCRWKKNITTAPSRKGAGEQDAPSPTDVVYEGYGPRPRLVERDDNRNPYLAEFADLR